jgi:hypothetical protein
MHEDKCYKKNMQQDKILWMDGSYNEHTCKFATLQVYYMQDIMDGSYKGWAWTKMYGLCF